MKTESHLNLVSPSTLTPMDRVQLARHDRRPYALDFVQMIFSNFRELHGDRCYRDDPAMITGTALLDGRPVMVIGHQKGRHLRERQMRNFGMPKPDGYRKAMRFMELADKFARPILCFIDTPGAFPGIDAEERGQAQAIANNLRQMSRIKVPIVVTITGEGGSGGALAIAVGDNIKMLENSTYSVITPEGCAAILWKDAARAESAAESLKITAKDLMALNLIDEIILEPLEGAQENWEATAALVKKSIQETLGILEKTSIKTRLQNRYEKYRVMGKYLDL